MKKKELVEQDVYYCDICGKKIKHYHKCDYCGKEVCSEHSGLSFSEEEDTCLECCKLSYTQRQKKYQQQHCKHNHIERSGGKFTCTDCGMLIMDMRE
jgi:hypothetical protein